MTQDPNGPGQPQGGGGIMKLFEGPGEESLGQEQRAMVELGRSVFSELEKLVRSITLYGREHQAVETFRQKLLDAFQAAFRVTESVVVEVAPYDFLMFDQIVYQNSNPDGNFVYKFFSDGVRELSFSYGLDQRQIDAWIEILLTNWEDPALFEDDSVTLMWEAEFEHIDYQVIESFMEALQEQEDNHYTIDGVMENVKQGASGIVAPGEGAGGGGAGGTGGSGSPGGPPGGAPSGGPAPRIGVATDSRLVGGMGGGGIHARQAAGRLVSMDPSAQVSFVNEGVVCERLSQGDLDAFVESPFAMDEQELMHLQGTMSASTRVTLEKFIEILFKVHVAETSEVHEKSLQVFERIAQLLTTSGRYTELERVLRKVRGLTGPGGELLPENLGAIEEIFAEIGNRAFVENLVGGLRDPEFEHTRAVIDVLRMLNTDAGLALAELFGVLPAGTARQAVLAVLPELLGDRFAELAPIVQNAPRAQAHDLLRMLKNVDHPGIEAVIRMAISHQDPSIRYEALSAIPPPRLLEYIEYVYAALADPSKLVRSRAIQVLARIPHPEVHARIMAQVQDKEFASTELDEKRRYCAAAALTGDPSAYFMSLLSERGLLKGKQHDEMRSCAAMALALRMHRPAVDLLRKEAGRTLGSDLMKSACAWGLQHMACDRQERTRQLYDIFYRGELSTKGQG